jgi:CheY-like chemotaxis protein
MLQVLTFAKATTHGNECIILVVDDEPDICETVKDLLESCIAGASVRTAPSGRAALEVLGREHVDLIVTDYKMPGMNGVQLLSEAEHVAPGLPHILITAFDPELVRELGPHARGEHIVRKPFDADRLVAEVERALAIQ